jgi:hypothetical protein
MVFLLLEWAWVPMHSTKDLIMEAVPVAQAAAAKKNEVIHTHLKISLIELDLLFMNAFTLKRKKYSEEELRNEFIRMIISVNEKILLI